MTEQEILQAINKVQGMPGMTVNERLFTTGLMNEFDNAKHNDPDKARFILEHLRVDKPSIDKIIKFATAKRISVLLLLTIANIGLTMFLLSVLADTIVDYRKAFWGTTPIIFGLTYFFVKGIFKQVLKQKSRQISILPILTIVVFIIDILILALNIYCWFDLKDGTTNTMFP